MSTRNNIVTIQQAVARAHADGLPISEGALRSWIRSGVLPVRKVGNRNLVYYPTLVAYLCGHDTMSGCPKNGNISQNLRNIQKGV